MTRAGQKIRAFREAAGLSAEAFGEKYGFSEQTVYGWETRGKAARPPAMVTLQQNGICELSDWTTAAIAEDGEPGKAA